MNVWTPATKSRVPFGSLPTVPQPEIKHVALTVATIAKERIVSLDIHTASLILGVRLILTHLDLADVKLSG